MADTSSIDWNAFLTQLGPQGRAILGNVFYSLGINPSVTKPPTTQAGTGSNSTSGSGTSYHWGGGSGSGVNQEGENQTPESEWMDPYGNIWYKMPDGTWHNTSTGESQSTPPDGYSPGDEWPYTGGGSGGDDPEIFGPWQGPTNNIPGNNNGTFTWYPGQGWTWTPNFNPEGGGGGGGDSPGTAPPGYHWDPTLNGYIPDDQDPSTLPPPPADPSTGPTTPAPNSWGSQTPLFQQGSNNQYTPDPFSTSPDWRAPAPTGGLYGAFSELAGGGLTPYENQVGQGYLQFAQGGFNPQEQQVYGQLGNLYDQMGQYARTPGTGEYEAYGAYSKMLNSGYSPEEQAAIAGSGMRAANQQYQQLRDQMERKARATGGGQGYYAAMTGMAGQQAGTLGEQARQNQILFANEKQRRAETGAQGMTNVGQMGAQRSQFGLGQQANLLGQKQGMNQASRGYQLAGLQGAQGWSGYGRGLQQTGLQGLQNLMSASQQGQGSLYGLLGSLLGTKQEDYTELGQTTGNFTGSYGMS